MLPNFIIVGAAKSGTTSLYHYLSEHPDIYMSEPKEVNFFSGDEIENQGLYYKDFKARSLSEYKSLFTKSGGASAVGEGSVSYLFYPETPKKIHALLPKAKIVILLRNPLDRGYSHYLMDHRLGFVDIAYSDVVHKSTQTSMSDLYFQQYVELGLYYEQVKRYIDMFGHDQVKIYLMDDIKSDINSVVDDLYDFLQVDQSSKPDLEAKHNTFAAPNNEFIRKLYAFHGLRSMMSFFVPKPLKKLIMRLLFNGESKPKLEGELVKHLNHIYLPDIKKLEKLIGRDLSAWYLYEK